MMTRVGSQQHRSFFRPALVGFGVLLYLSTLGCNNNFNLAKIAGTKITASDPNSQNGDSSGSFTLAQVLKNTLDPNNTIDLLDNGSGTFGSLCIPASGSAGTPTDPTVCSCNFSYSSPSNPNQVVDFPVTYHESDLLRCNYSALPADATSVQVRVHLTSAGTYSNAINFSLSATGTANTTDPLNFALVRRYQCRDLVFIPYLLDGTMYDPLQSEDYKLTYPLDFYTTNIGNALSAFVTASSSNANLAFWNCPAIVNPNDYLTGTNLTNFISANHINLKVYSKADPGDGGGKVIYPYRGGFDRSTFYVSKAKAGIFNVAVNSYQSPGVITADGSSNPSLGYAAPPISQGVGVETCSDPNRKIPSGYHWAKLWLFRASLPQRSYKTSPDITNIQSITCNPGEWDSAGSGANSNVFSTSPQTAYTFSGPNPTAGFGGIQIDTFTFPVPFTPMPTHRLADRVLGTGGSGQTIRLDLGTLQAGGPSCAAATPIGPGCNSGADIWSVQDTLANRTLRCGGTTPPLDPLGMCSTTAANNNVADTKTPLTTTSLGIGQLDVGASRYDFLFVVSPEKITLKDMQRIDASSVSLPYQPFRFYTDVDCSLDDPDGFSGISGDCAAKNMISTYGLKLHDMGNLGDPPASDPNRPGVFPMCVIQPD